MPQDLESDPELLDAVRLNLVPGIGPRLQQTLLEAFGSPSGVFEATSHELQQVDGIGPKISTAIVAHRDPTAAQRELERCRQAGVSLLRRGSGEYPRMLAQICDAPSILYCKKNLEARDE